MNSSHVKTVLIGISGGVAAYKSCEVLRGLQKAGVRVKVVMTEHATHFVNPLTFRALTNEPVAIGLFDDPQDPIHHISLAQEADVFLLAPCTANVIAKAAHGIADDLLSTTILATTAPIMVAPAMNVHMYENPATQENIATLKRRGFSFIEAGEGYLACGDVGKGRMADPEIIVNAVLKKLEQISNPTQNNRGNRAGIYTLLLKTISPPWLLTPLLKGFLLFSLHLMILSRIKPWHFPQLPPRPFLILQPKKISQVNAF